MHIAARAPSNLVGGDAEPMPAPSITMAASTSLRATSRADLGGDVGIVHRIGAVGADVEHAEAALAQVVAERGLEGNARMIAANRDRT